ncbi:hypothetical protein FHR83_004503 [Actinoplanes campanulatus]|uniref:Secreted protein n=1 Tax=Actinoplanes campanulatus TaxID=113559 RepID=A0A7W5AJ19_9ACTN|nr:hypothetical protein [Actinoplanes campanulatus]MBB3096829.1 hypothetical protein [Actinoplanes campanulatus]GGN44407.1 hypothetical protein GCM10010109_77620 [Actinoplanes campanulatus]GID37373.1 hypothetical protein Aca09nite_38790 [Actinoplanes campanulatus]
MKHFSRKAFAVAALAAGALMLAPAAAQAGGHPGGVDIDQDTKCVGHADTQNALVGLQNVDVQALSGLGILGQGTANQNDIFSCAPSIF